MTAIVDKDNQIERSSLTPKQTSLEVHSQTEICDTSLKPIRDKHNPKTTDMPSLKRKFSLLTAFEVSHSLVALLKETDFYYNRLLDVCRQDCSSAQSVVLLQNMIQKQKMFEVESKVALAQVPKMANMQLEVERLKVSPITPPVAKLLNIDTKRSFRLEFSLLDQFNVSQLQVIANDMLKTISSMNSTLMEQLMERDELHLEQGGKIADMEDIRSWIKDLNIQAQNPQLRRQLLHNLLAANYPRYQTPKQEESRQKQSQTKSKWMMSLFRHKSAISSTS